MGNIFGNTQAETYKITYLFCGDDDYARTRCSLILRSVFDVAAVYVMCVVCTCTCSIYVWVHMHVFTCVSICIICMCMYMCVCTCVYVCVFMCMCMCVYIRMIWDMHVKPSTTWYL